MLGPPLQVQLLHLKLEHVKEEQLAQAKKEPEKTKTISAMASGKALLSLPNTALHCAEGALRIHIGTRMSKGWGLPGWVHHRKARPVAEGGVGSRKKEICPRSAILQTRKLRLRQAKRPPSQGHTNRLMCPFANGGQRGECPTQVAPLSPTSPLDWGGSLCRYCPL